MDSHKNNVITSAAHYAVYLGMFWVFKYIFLITSQYAGDFYLYIFNLLSIGTPILFYALAIVYRDKRLGGTINYGQVILFAIFLFLFASLIESVIIAIHIMVLDPHYLSNFQERIYLEYENRGLPNQLLKILKQGLNFGSITFLVSQVMANIISGVFISVIFGYLVCRKKQRN